MGKFKVLLFGEHELKKQNGTAMLFKSEEEAYEIMWVNFPFITDFKVVKQ